MQSNYLEMTEVKFSRGLGGAASCQWKILSKLPSARKTERTSPTDSEVSYAKLNNHTFSAIPFKLCCNLQCVCVCKRILERGDGERTLIKQYHKYPKCEGGEREREREREISAM